MTVMISGIVKHLGHKKNWFVSETAHWYDTVRQRVGLRVGTKNNFRFLFIYLFLFLFFSWRLMVLDSLNHLKMFFVY